MCLHAYVHTYICFSTSALRMRMWLLVRAVSFWSSWEAARPCESLVLLCLLGSPQPTPGAVTVLCLTLILGTLYKSTQILISDTFWEKITFTGFFKTRNSQVYSCPLKQNKTLQLKCMLGIASLFQSTAVQGNRWALRIAVVLCYGKQAALCTWWYFSYCHIMRKPWAQLFDSQFM